MGWGSDERTLRPPTGGFQSPPANDLPTSTPREAYSYARESPGYTETVLKHARLQLQQLQLPTDDLSPFFDENPGTPKRQLAREYFTKLLHNEQAAIREVHEKPVHKPEPVAGAWNIGD